MLNPIEVSAIANSPEGKIDTNLKLGDEVIELFENSSETFNSNQYDQNDNFLPSFEIAANGNDWPGRTADSAAEIAAVASEGISQKFWALSTYAETTVNGQYGCAAAVSEKLQMASVPISDAATVSQVDVSLRERGWNVEYLVQPGCVAIAHTPGNGWRKGGGNAHVGIVDKYGRICNNESKGGGLWKCEPLSEAFRPKLTQRYLLCPPGS